ncbi:MAG: MBL fold metallo-hydrolase [Candidatus Magasanikbacteria bacterium]|nr:MBL fold metallo-hydrolase [Candidatus Magasanikbacteria bacterium]
MRLTFFGAAHEVTGSCYLLEAAGRRILIDCGLFQGSDWSEGRNRDALPFSPSTIDAVLVTHAHLDHTGRIPKLVRKGFSGRIFMTQGTKELARIVWEDAFEVMDYEHRKFQAPLIFDMADIATAYAQSHGVDYYGDVEVAPGIVATWKDAGHIFGSGFITVVAEGRRLIFSGDVGNLEMPILRDTDQLGSADVLCLESTYGDRRHETREERYDVFLSLVAEGAARGGTIMVPAFSIERTQELLYALHNLSSHEESWPRIPMFLDSPMAIDALAIYKQHHEYYDREAARLYLTGEDFFSFPQLRLTRTREESKIINGVRGPKLIIAGAGMMNGGRILHHAHRYLSDPNSTLIIIGYQAQGTLGRRLYEGAETVTIFGDTVPVRCVIKAIGGFSAHADQNKLVSWVRAAKHLPGRVYCTHGEPAAATALAHRLRDELAVKAFVPNYGDVVTI